MAEEQPTEPNLEERSFVQGLKAGPLPAEPEPLDRKFYNLGLEVYHIQRRLVSAKGGITEIIMDVTGIFCSEEIKESYKKTLISYVKDANQDNKRFQQILGENPSLQKYLHETAVVVEKYFEDINNWKKDLERHSRG
ncbi:hypothetical protein KY339_04755 [Candidatus Woesearchaeota archaeon]|nr:hypothetical protein [Candidatus Woesearchaeota archaeon]